MKHQRVSAVCVLFLILMSVLAATIIPPWIQLQRELSRGETCANQLRECGVHFQVFGERDARKRYCSGAFDLATDGCPDANSWIGNLRDIQQEQVLLLCPANPVQGADTLNQLIGYERAPDRPLTMTRLEVKLTHLNDTFCAPFALNVPHNVERAEATLQSGDEARVAIVRKAVSEGFNTNYAASWFLARQTNRFARGMNGQNGGLIYCKGEQTDHSGSYEGLAVRFAEKSHIATSAIPLLGDAAVADNLSGVLAASLNDTLRQGASLSRTTGIGPLELAGDMTFNKLSDHSQPTAGNYLNIRTLALDDTLPLPDKEGFGGVDLSNPPDGKNEPITRDLGGYGGQDGRLFLQDTRQWASVHRVNNRRELNLLFADGSTKALPDANGDGFINPGFPIDSQLSSQDLTEQVGYTNLRCEVSPANCYSGPFLDLSFIKKDCFEGGDGGGGYVGPMHHSPAASRPAFSYQGQGPGWGGDKYGHKNENEFHAVADEPLSTFSIDVDTASYTKVRQFIEDHQQLPPPEAVRLEEFINYFDYHYAPPADKHPFAVHLATATCPWQKEHYLVRIGLKGREIPRDEQPPMNLVFLVDVSGSMSAANKLPLVQQGLHLLTDQLRPRDRVAMVVYAGAAGLVLPSTSGDQKKVIHAAIHSLSAGGSTNGGAGIQLAYAQAKEQLLPKGSNRVILCTDGDFNVGVTSTGELVNLATAESKQGVFLTLLGFGIGNLNDDLLENLSKNANGNYYFIDDLREARKVLVDQMSGTVNAIAKDVKIQVEFNPLKVAQYRLLGYENRLLANRDFNDDKKDAGEIGAGHSVTAMYEIVPSEAGDSEQKEVDPLLFQKERQLTEVAQGDTLLNVKLRYKPIDGDTSVLIERPCNQAPVRFQDAPADMQLATTVAMFGMLLSRSKFMEQSSWGDVMEFAARSAKDDEQHQYRTEFLALVANAKKLMAEQPVEKSARRP